MVLAMKILQFIFCACAQTRMYDFLFTLGSMSLSCLVFASKTSLGRFHCGTKT